MESFFWIIWDVAAVLVIAYYIARSARHGFLRTVVSFIGYAISAVAAGLLSTPLASFAYDALVRDLMRAVITRRVAEAVESGGEAAQSLLASVPAWMQNLLGGSDVSGSLGSFDVAGAAGAAESLLETALADPVITLLRGLFFFILFAVFSMIARHLSRAFTGVNRLPVIGALNTFLGGVLGVLQAALVLYIVAVAVRLIIILSGESWEILSVDAVEAGYIFRYFWHMSG